MAIDTIEVEIKVVKSFYYYLISNLPKSLVGRFGKLICHLLRNKILLKTKVKGQKEEKHTFKQIIGNFKNLKQ